MSPGNLTPHILSSAFALPRLSFHFEYMADIEDANIPVSPFPEPLDGDQDFQSHDEPLKLEIRRPVRLADRWSWSPLTNDHDIRVMIIEPARNIRDVITCTFRTISIKDDPKQEYSALSYAWGDSFEDNRHLTEYIHCGSNVLRITRTLRQALQRIRNMAKLGILAATLPIWIDAICINQRNTPERNHQVAIMGSIYRCLHESVCLAWRRGQCCRWTGKLEFNTGSPSRAMAFMAISTAYGRTTEASGQKSLASPLVSSTLDCSRVFAV